MPKPPIDRTAEMIGHLAEGQAALFLGESLMLALINAGVIDKDKVLEAIDVVIAAKRTIAAEGHEPEIARASAALLASISTSIAAAGEETGDPPDQRPRKPRRTSRSSPN